MRIALTTSFEYTTPPPPDIMHAPLRLTAKLADELVDRGHNVTLFAAEGSSSKARCVSAGLHPLAAYEEMMETCDSTWEKEGRYRFIDICDQYLLSRLYRMAQEGAFDIVHFNSGLTQKAICLAPLVPTPTVVTLHDPVDVPWQGFLHSLYDNVPQLSFMSISNAQRAWLPGLNYSATVYNGIEVSDYPFSSSPQDHLLFAGRLVPEKGVAMAVQVARKANQKLLIAGSWIKQDYFDSEVKPFLGQQIQFLGMVNYDKMPQLYGKAKALLFPIRWEEPFGLAMIEAMACGTPVIAFRKGSVPEIVIDGKTGFIVDSEDEMVEAVKRIDQIDRAECRKHVERHFTMSHMVDNYITIYRRVLLREIDREIRLPRLPTLSRV